MQPLHPLEEQVGLLPETFHRASRQHHPGPDVLFILEQAVPVGTQPWVRTSGLAAAGVLQVKCL